MKLPCDDLHEEVRRLPGDLPRDKVIFINPYFGKEHLTRIEAIDLINQMTGMLLVDERGR